MLCIICVYIIIHTISRGTGTAVRQGVVGIINGRLNVLRGCEIPDCTYLVYVGKMIKANSEKGLMRLGGPFGKKELIVREHPGSARLRCSSIYASVRASSSSPLTDFAQYIKYNIPK